ncbi:hypothetical protein H4R34_005600 [Dimargaris verticillata]|uniref:Armadillo-type protein n=1 Tax=Dimargaris verticillata TaxID=2761393 RepID=A0A9W8B0A7_9FUNG|nr:hypothetical protein H4R34_005600 [Dimargaris verticillata]
MARITLWFLAAVAAANLAHATPVPMDDRNTADIGSAESSADAQRLQTIANYGPPPPYSEIDPNDQRRPHVDTLLGESSSSTSMDQNSLGQSQFGSTSQQFNAGGQTDRSVHVTQVLTDARIKLDLPSMEGLYARVGQTRKGLHAQVDMSSAEKPSARVDLSIKHSLANLGLEAGVDFILDVIVALFEALESGHLLDNFRAIADQVLSELQSKHGANSDDQAPAALDITLPINFHAVVYNWLYEMVGEDTTKLRYYLSNLLAFQVIPRIIGQMLESDKDHTYERALDFAKRVKHVAGVKWVAEQLPEYVPNYFEFIVKYAIQRQLPRSVKLVGGIYDAMDKTEQEGVQYLYKCKRGLNDPSPWNVLDSMFGNLITDIYKESLGSITQQCNIYFAKHIDGFKFLEEFQLTLVTLEEENTDSLLEKAEEHQG